jgi:hypothetical protein
LEFVHVFQIPKTEFRIPNARQMPRFAASALALVAIAGLAQISRGGVVHGILSAAAMPMCGAALALVVLSLSPRRLRRGWMLVTSSVAQS